MSRNARNGCVPPSPAIAPPSPTSLRLTVGDPVSEPTNDSEERVLQDGFWEHGRFYGSWKPGKYHFPIDKEELNRLDIFHKFFLIARDDRIFSFPLSKEGRPKILDLGTGTGIWAFNVVEDYVANAEIMAVDLNQIQPALIPRGVTTIQFDIEEPSWEPLLRDCELVHLRTLFGSIKDDLWPSIYRNAFEHLAPGKGYIEQLEIDWTPRWEGDEVPVHSALNEWSQKFQRAMHRYQRSVKVSSQDTKRMMEAAGFTDFTETTVRCYVNPFSPDRHDRELGRWFNLAITLGLQAMSMMPMIENLGMTEADVVDLCERVKSEMCILRFHAYCTLHIWTAKRPPSRPQ
ncbi:methyl transferase [Trichoderma arundinaceum]|uniref:Methyl transferase n=1 Tax=Trichoderma arundinaceum TaxID=490622 RepID=A0A395N802_TRIAR|nr:methyl transferase [Trichoderma arundinaceum]